LYPPHSGISFPTFIKPDDKNAEVGEESLSGLPTASNVGPSGSSELVASSTLIVPKAQPSSDEDGVPKVEGILHECPELPLKPNCFWKDSKLYSLIGKPFPLMNALPAASSTLDVLFIFLDKIRIDKDDLRMLDPLRDEPIKIFLVCGNVVQTVSDAQIEILADPDQKFKEFFEYHLAKYAPAQLFVLGKTIVHIGPSIGNSEFNGMFDPCDFAAALTPGWVSPQVGCEFPFKHLFTDETLYLPGSRSLTTLPPVLLLHNWNHLCPPSIEKLPEYAELARKYPSWVQVLIHVDGSKSPASQDDISKYNQEGLSELIQIWDVSGSFCAFTQLCDFHFNPCTIIVVHGTVIYVGGPHIACDPLYFPTLVDNALGE
jgi:hypothetical protein